MIANKLLTKLSKWRELSARDTASSLLTGGAAIGVAAVVQVSVGIATVAILARCLGPDGKGKVDLCFATANVLMLLVGFSLPSGIVYTVASGRSSPRALVRSLGWLLLLQAAVGAVLLSTVAVSPWRRFFLPEGAAPAIVAVVSGLQCALLYTAAFRSVLMGQKEYVQASGVDIGKQMVWLIVLIGWAGVMTITGESIGFLSVAWIQAVSIACGTLFSLRAILRSPASGSGTDGLRDVFAYSTPCYFANLVQTVNYRLGAFIVNWFCGAGTLGVYQLAATISEGFSIIPGTIASLLLPTVASNAASSREMALLTFRVTRVVAVAVGAGWLLVSFGGYFLVPMVFGSAFRDSVPLLFVLLFSRVLGVYTGILAGYLAGLGKPALNMRISIVTALLNIVIQLVLVPRFGAMGAAVGTSIVALCSAVLTSWVTLKCTTLGMRELFPRPIDDLKTVRVLVCKFRGA